jgi:hypothetical protein
MKPLLSIIAAVSLMSPAHVLAQTSGVQSQPAETEAQPADAQAQSGNTSSGPVRPGDAEGNIAESDGLAECAAILAAAASRSNNIIDRNRMKSGSASWFAASGDLAIEEGALPEAQLWETKVSEWSGQIGSVDSLAGHSDWMSYCVGIGQSRGLETTVFAAHLNKS